MIRFYRPCGVEADILGEGMPAAERRERIRHPLSQLVWLGVIAAGLLVAVLAELRAEPAPSDTAQALAQVLAADQALGDAIRTGDKSAARKLLALQFTYVDGSGRVHERKEFLGSLKNIGAAPAADPKSAVYGTVAVVTGEHKSNQNGDVFVLHIWAKQKGAWRVLTIQDVGLGTSAMAATDPDVPGVEPASYECKNPCQAIPYRVRSPAEQEVINTFQAIAKAVVAHDAAEWGKHVADEFVHYRSGQTPVAKTRRVAIIEDQKTRKIPAVLGAVQSMRLWVFGDGATMISTDGAGDETEPLLRVARVWTKANGQWRLALSAQTVVKTP